MLLLRHLQPFNRLSSWRLGPASLLPSAGVWRATVKAVSGDSARLSLTLTVVAVDVFFSVETLQKPVEHNSCCSDWREMAQRVSFLPAF